MTAIYENDITNMMKVPLPGLWLWSKDINSFFLGNSQSIAKFFGFKYCNEMIGRSDYELRCDAAALADTFRKCDRQVMINRSQSKFFEILKSATHETRIILANKLPLLNADHQVIGTFGHAMDVTEPLFKLGSLLSSRSTYATKLNPSSFVVGGNLAAKLDLTPRQSECLFFLLRFKTSKQISAILNISPRTVEEHIDKLKIKFNCTNKNELLEEATNHGFLNFIPDSIFNKQLSMALALE